MGCFLFKCKFGCRLHQYLCVFWAKMAL